MKYTINEVIICYMMGISTLKDRRICSIKEIEQYNELIIKEKNIEVDSHSIKGLSNLLYVNNEYIMIFPWIERNDLIEKYKFNPLALQNLCDTSLILKVDVLDDETLNKLKKIQIESDFNYLQELKEEIKNNEKKLKLINDRLK